MKPRENQFAKTSKLHCIHRMSNKTRQSEESCMPAMNPECQDWTLDASQEPWMPGLDPGCRDFGHWMPDKWPTRRDQVKRPGCETRKQQSDLDTARTCLQATRLPGFQAAASRGSFWPIGGCRQALVLEGNVAGTLGISRQSPLAPGVRHAAAWGRLQEPARGCKEAQRSLEGRAVKSEFW